MAQLTPLLIWKCLTSSGPNGQKNSQNPFESRKIHVKPSFLLHCISARSFLSPVLLIFGFPLLSFASLSPLPWFFIHIQSVPASLCSPLGVADHRRRGGSKLIAVTPLLQFTALILANLQLSLWHMLAQISTSLHCTHAYRGLYTHHCWEQRLRTQTDSGCTVCTVRVSRSHASDIHQVLTRLRANFQTSEQFLWKSIKQASEGKQIKKKIRCFYQQNAYGQPIFTLTRADRQLQWPVY